MAARSLILQAELDEIVEKGFQSSWLSSEAMMAKGTGVTAQKEEDTSCCGLQLGRACLPSRNPRDQVFEGEKGLFHPGLRPLLGDSMEMVEMRWWIDFF